MVAIQREGLLLQSVHDEILVFNPDRSEATALNRSAALVFELCDGANTIESMRLALDDAGLGPATDDAVWLALTELAEADLVDLAGPPADHLGRRELLKKIGIGAAATAAILPVVETIAAPSAAAQGSGPGSGPGEPSTTIAPTVSPTTVSPTTVSPTVSPTTVSPTTISLTVSPTTVSPTTVSPTTISLTVSPTTARPTPAPATPNPTTTPT